MSARVQQIERWVNLAVGKPLAWALYGIGWAAWYSLVALRCGLVWLTRPKAKPAPRA